MIHQRMDSNMKNKGDKKKIKQIYRLLFREEIEIFSRGSCKNIYDNDNFSIVYNNETDKYDVKYLDYTIHCDLKEIKIFKNFIKIGMVTLYPLSVPFVQFEVNIDNLIDIFNCCRVKLIKKEPRIIEERRTVKYDNQIIQKYYLKRVSNGRQRFGYKVIDDKDIELYVNNLTFKNGDIFIFKSGIVMKSDSYIN